MLAVGQILITKEVRVMGSMDDLLNLSGFDNEKDMKDFIMSKMKISADTYLKMFDAGFFDTFGDLVSNEETGMDAYCYFVVTENAQKGDIIEIPYMPGLVPEHVKEQLEDTELQVTSLMMSSISLRNMMLSAMMYGVWWQRNIDALDNLWKTGEDNA